MDRVSEAMLAEFSKERDIANLSEDKRFEHFISFITVGRHYVEHFDTSDVLVGEATGIDGGWPRFDAAIGDLSTRR